MAELQASVQNDMLLQGEGLGRRYCTRRLRLLQSLTGGGWVRGWGCEVQVQVKEMPRGEGETLNAASAGVRGRLSASAARGWAAEGGRNGKEVRRSRLALVARRNKMHAPCVGFAHFSAKRVDALEGAKKMPGVQRMMTTIRIIIDGRHSKSSGNRKTVKKRIRLLLLLACCDDM